MSQAAQSKASLLDLYFRKTAVSALPNGYAPYFQLGKILWGYGLIDDSGHEDVLLDIPGDYSEMDSTFADCMPAYNYINGKTVITATLPKTAIPDGESREWSMCLLTDVDGEAVGALVITPQMVNNKMDVSVTLEIDHVAQTTNMQLA